MSPTMTANQRKVRCSKCELMQYLNDSEKCRRCGQMLGSGAVEVSKIVIVMPGPNDSDITLRQAMQRAAVAAIAKHKHMGKAAAVLDIHVLTLRNLLREAGDLSDRRKIPRKVRKPKP